MDLFSEIIQSSLEAIKTSGIHNMQIGLYFCYENIEELAPAESGAY